MASKTPCLESANVALIRGPYKEVVEKSLSVLADSEDTLIIDAADVFNDFIASKYNVSPPGKLKIFYVLSKVFKLPCDIDYQGEECMELSKGFVERLSEIFFYEEERGEEMEHKLSNIFLNTEMGNNILKGNNVNE